MKNTLLVFDTEEVGDFISPNYFSKKIDLYNFLTDDIKKNFCYTYKIDDNDKIERISYSLYKTTDYWDLLLLLNGRESLSDMPYDYETYTNTIDQFIDEYNSNYYSNYPLNDTKLSDLKTEFYEKERHLNESFRYMLVIKPEKLQEFLKLIKLAGYEW